jgi:AcrR family transcriptional regulator
MSLTDKIGVAERRALVLAAIDAIATRGADGLRPDGVAREAGVDAGVVAHHFATPGELGAAVAEEVVDRIVATLVMRCGPAAPLAVHLQAVGRLISEQPALFLVLADLELRGRRDPLVRAGVKRAERRWRVALEAAIPEPLGATADLILALTKGAALDAVNAPAVFDRLVALLQVERA